MTRKEEIINYANSFKGVGVENEELKETIRLAIIDGAMWADEHPIHYDGKAYLYVLHKGVEQGKKGIIDKIKSLIKEWELCTSAEAKYKVEAYKELMEIIEKEE